MRGKIFARLVKWLASRPDGYRLCWIALLLALAWEYLGRPFIQARYPELALPSLQDELLELLALAGM